MAEVLHRLGQLYYDRQRYPEALDSWLQAFVHDRRLGHDERELLKEKIDHLVQDQHLESTYKELCQTLGIGDGI